MELLTSAQMRAIEQAAIDGGEVTGLELMERAGAGAVEAIFEWRPELAEGERRAVVLCGPGNNGGDGFVVARLLKQRGWTVEVFLYGDEAKLPPDAAENARRWRDIGTIQRLTFPEVTETDGNAFAMAAYGISNTEVIVDALFGTGLTRPINGLKACLGINDMYSTFDDMMPAKTVSLDIPSGVCSDSGQVLHSDGGGEMPWDAIQADLTVTFHRPKRGHFLAQGPIYSGRIIVADIGL